MIKASAAWRALRSGLRLHSLAQVLLLSYACALVVAAVQLNAWRSEVTHTLLQLSADRHFLARVALRGETIDPEWYRRKALSLISMAEKLDHNPLWSVVIPGSWQRFDELQQRLALRIEEEFAEVVVETMIRELYRRASQLTGMPQHAASGELITSRDCQSPRMPDHRRVLSASAEDLPEFAALQLYVADVERLDAAAAALLALNAGYGSAEQLQGLAEYTLGARLPTRLAESPRLFRQREEVNVRPVIMLERLQWATRCTLYKGQSALHMRLFATNDLFALEGALNEEQAGLFTPAGLSLPFDQSVARYRSVLTLLQKQESLLARGHNAWMTEGISRLGPGYEKLLASMAGTRLLGPHAIEQMNARSGAAFAGFRKQFDAIFGDEKPGVVWVEDRDRFALSPEREGLRRGLASLLELPFMAAQPAAATHAPAAAGRLAQALSEAGRLAEARRKFVAEALPSLPTEAAAVIAQVVDRRVAQLIFEKTHAALVGSLPHDRKAPLDPTVFRRQRAEAAAVRAHLDEIGAATLGRRLEATLDNEVMLRLRLLFEQWRAQPIYSPAVADLNTWQGDKPPVWPALGINDKQALQVLLTRQARQMEALTLQAETLLGLGGPALAHHPTVQQWRQMLVERDRYRARNPRSSLLGFERYLLGLGDVRLENCAEQLGQFAPPANDDALALRWTELHGALTSRCFRLRSRPVEPGAPPGLARGYERSPSSTVG